MPGLWGGARADVLLYRAFACEDLLLGLLQGAFRPGESGSKVCNRWGMGADGVLRGGDRLATRVILTVIPLASSRGMPHPTGNNHAWGG